MKKKSDAVSQNKRNIFVIGGAGYVGSRLVPRLLEDGHRVVVADLLWFGDHLPKNVSILKIDALDLTEHTFKGFDTVIFLSGLSNDPMAEFNTRMNFMSNAPTPAYNAMLAKKAGVKRFIYASTCSVYGLANDEEVAEHTPALAQFHYGVSKYMGETGCRMLADDNFEVVALRKGTISGYSPRMRYDLLLNTMYMTAATKKQIVVRNPDIWRPLLAISDAVEAYVWALDCKPGVYNIVSENVQLGLVARNVVSFFKEHFSIGVLLREERLFDNRNYRASNVFAAANGFIPKWNTANILEELASHLGVHADFEKDEGYNIRVLQKL